jgi:hypothetical protein
MREGILSLFNSSHGNSVTYNKFIIEVHKDRTNSHVIAKTNIPDIPLPIVPEDSMLSNIWDE